MLMMFIDKICNKDRFSKFQKTKLLSSLNTRERRLYGFVDDYFKDYCAFSGISIDDVLDIKQRFAKDYTNDIEKFIETGNYPIEIASGNQRSLERHEYDVILISSYLLEKPRFEILLWLSQQKFINKKILAIGIGPGVELAVILDFLKCQCTVEAYDLEFSDFVNNRYGDKVKKELFTCTNEKFDVVILIEVLEHVSNPVDLLTVSSKSMADGGHLYATTAIDIPQFDHLYNFKQNEIRDLMQQSKLDIIEVRKIEHGTILSKINSINEVVEAVKQ
jgi:hypothetical protein